MGYLVIILSDLCASIGEPMELGLGWGTMEKGTLREQDEIGLDKPYSAVMLRLTSLT